MLSLPTSPHQFLTHPRNLFPFMSEKEQIASPMFLIPSKLGSLKPDMQHTLRYNDVPFSPHKMGVRWLGASMLRARGSSLPRQVTGEPACGVSSEGSQCPPRCPLRCHTRMTALAAMSSWALLPNLLFCAD